MHTPSTHSLHPVYPKHVEMVAQGVITFLLLHCCVLHAVHWYCSAGILQYSLRVTYIHS